MDCTDNIATDARIIFACGGVFIATDARIIFATDARIIFACGGHAYCHEFNGEFC
jgi:hypothetical protein